MLQPLNLEPATIKYRGNEKTTKEEELSLMILQHMGKASTRRFCVISYEMYFPPNVLVNMNNNQAAHEFETI